MSMVTSTLGPPRREHRLAVVLLAAANILPVAVVASAQGEEMRPDKDLSRCKCVPQTQGMSVAGLHLATEHTPGLP